MKTFFSGKNILLLASLVFTAISCNPFSQSIVAGVEKTVNGGADWQQANTVTNPSGTSLSAANISMMALEPGHREVVFAGSYNAGLYKSDDSAGSWKKILSKIGVYDFVFNPLDTKNIYVAGFFDTHGRVLATKDGGATWQELYNEEVKENAVRSIALNVNQPSQIVIGTAAGALIKSSDSGLSWSLIKNFDDQINRIVWVNGNLYILLKTKGLQKTSDFGLTFQDVTTTLSAATGAFGERQVEVFSQLYVDPLSSQLLYVTTNKGLYKSIDGGVNWSHIVLPVDQGDSATKSIAVSVASSNIVYTSVGGTIYKSTDGGATWQTQNIGGGGFINVIIVDPSLPQISYAGIYGNNP
jgi:photosystem II stability/assembly factor-like uncharacterized protein